MNNLQKCAKGHQFDPGRHSRCPFCGVADSPAGKFESKEPDNTPTKKYEETKKTEKYDEFKKNQTNGISESDATVAVWSKEIGIDPIVGWLVCIGGKSLGRDYRIRSGLNNIGRETSNSICLAADETISRVDHCTIFYDLKKAAFYISAGVGRSGVYVNDNVVLQPTQLNPMDVIEIGQTRLAFVAFCGDHFRWEIPA